MWEVDKNMLNNYKSCYQNLFNSIKEGEDVELTQCEEETKAFATYLKRVMDDYVSNHPHSLSTGRAGNYSVKIPDYQDL